MRPFPNFKWKRCDVDKGTVHITHNAKRSATVFGTGSTVSEILNNSVRSLSGPSAHYSPSSLFSSGQLHTIAASVCLKKHAPHIRYRDVALMFPDGGNTTLSLSPPEAFGEKGDHSTTPIVVILHGILGNESAPYITPIVERLTASREQGGAGVRVAVLTLRGCGQTRMTSTTIHHATQTEDLSASILYLSTKYPNSSRFGIGCSMGANILTNYLGHRGEGAGLAGALAISGVYDLPACFNRLRAGNAIDRHLVNHALGAGYHKILSRNAAIFQVEAPWVDALGSMSSTTPEDTLPLPFPTWAMSRTSTTSSSPSSFGWPLSGISTPMTQATSFIGSKASSPPSLHPAPERRKHIATSFATLMKGGVIGTTMTKFSEFVSELAGYATVDAFCEDTSAKHVVQDIRVPFLMINAEDDPMMPGAFLPREDVERNPFVAMAVTQKGGHLGWIAREKDKGGRRVQWHVDAVVEWINGLVDIGAKGQVEPRPTAGRIPGMTYEEGRPGVGFLETSKFFLEVIPLDIA